MKKLSLLNGLMCLTAILMITVSQTYAEPIVIKGKSVPALIGCPIESIRLFNRERQAVVFQIDEMTSDGEYICPQGDEPNQSSGNGILDSIDEIVFLWDDCQSVVSDSQIEQTGNQINLKISSGDQIREIFISTDTTISLSKKKYIDYDHEKRYLKTPWYYAEFGKDRFHFTKAGVKDFNTGRYIDLTNELRVEILLRALWGLLPIRYSEDNLVCLVKRYKCGPLRLIRRGDFHLNLGLGLRGSRAIVNQICYPQIIKVPVYIHAPVRFGSFFRDAYIEMTPVLKDVAGFMFRVPDGNISIPVVGETPMDTMIYLMPNHRFMAVSDGTKGYGWVLEAAIKNEYLENSAFVYRNPSWRSGSADCGFRMNIKNLPKGYYEITNWVLFQSSSLSKLRSDFDNVLKPAKIHSMGKTYSNELSASTGHRKLP